MKRHTVYPAPSGATIRPPLTPYHGLMAVSEDVITRWQGISPYAVWAGAVAAAIIIGLTAREQYLTWVPIAFAGAVIVTFLIQLGIQRKEGFVQRVTLSVAGAMVVLAIATGVFALLG